MKFCQKCGKELNDDAVICTGCGCAVPFAKESTSTHTFNQTPLKATGNTPYSYDSGTTDGLGIASIILGAVGIPFSLLLAITGYFFGGAGLALAIIGGKKNPSSGKSKVGLILSIITLSCSVVNSLIGFLMMV